MAVRVLLVVSVLVALYGCGQSSPAPQQGEKEDVEKAVGGDPALAQMTPKEACETFPSSQHAMEYLDNKATDAEERVLDSDGDGWPCNEASVVPASEAASTEPTGLQPSPEFYEWNCRGETYVIEQGMSAQESEAFGTEMGNRLADDIEAGGDKDMGDILDEMGVPAYEEEC
jgi:hypothetical protein